MTDERVAIVTGAGRGMGRAIAVALANRGVRTVVASRTAAELTETAAISDGTIHTVVCDVADPDQVDALVAETMEEFGRVDVLVCSHGVYKDGVDPVELTLEQFDQTLAVNLRGTLRCAQRAAAAMREGGRGGRIVFISSINAEAAVTGAVDYDVSKAAVNGLTRALAVNLAADEITVNSIAPGWIRTEMSAKNLGVLEGKGLTLNPANRVGSVEQVALAAMWLTDPGNDFVTGVVVNVDGGHSAMQPMPWDSTEVGTLHR